MAALACASMSTQLNQARITRSQRTQGSGLRVSLPVRSLRARVAGRANASRRSLVGWKSSVIESLRTTKYEGIEIYREESKIPGRCIVVPKSPNCHVCRVFIGDSVCVSRKASLAVWFPEIHGTTPAIVNIRVMTGKYNFNVYHCHE